MLSSKQRNEWDEQGFFIVPSFADASVRDEMLEATLDLVCRAGADEEIGPSYVVPEEKLQAGATRPEDRVSKVFRVHRQVPVFNEFAGDAGLGVLLEGLLGVEVDCFLSQFIFKLPGALGQPWHQDSFYFPFDRRPQVGVWLALTDTTLENGPLWVLPGSHREPVHEVVPDRREHASYGYVEIIDHDTSNEVPVLMKAGDLLLFHSNLFHKSTDNVSQAMRTAMVYHFASADTIDQSQEKWGFTPPNTDWMAVRRGGVPA
jgi:phytanoyl-CoA hydroxylase